MKTIVITGGSDGLGKALTEKLAKDYKIVILIKRVPISSLMQYPWPDEEGQH